MKYGSSASAELELNRWGSFELCDATQQTVQQGRWPTARRLISPKLLEVIQLEDEHGSLDQRQENVHSSIVGLAVDYLSRLPIRRAASTEDLSIEAADVFRVSLLGAARLSQLDIAPSAHADAVRALLGLTVVEHVDGSVSFAVDEIAVCIACQLATYDVGLRAGASMYNPASTFLVPDTQTIMHVLAMVERATAFVESYGPITKDGFVFADRELLAGGERGGYTDLVTSGDGDFLTEDTLWDFKVSVSKPTKDHTLHLLMYFFMGKRSGLREFADLTHVGIFNPRLNQVLRLEVASLPSEMVDVVRRDVIGYEV